jgi:hypothetical protein
VSETKLPQFTADSSLYMTNGHYRTNGRAFNLPVPMIGEIYPTMEVIQVRGCPAGYDQVGDAGDGEPLVCIEQQQGGSDGGGGSGAGSGGGGGRGGGGGGSGGGGTGGPRKGNGRDGGNYNPVEGGKCCGGPSFQSGTYSFDKDWKCCVSVNGSGCAGCATTKNGSSQVCKDGWCLAVASV